MTNRLYILSTVALATVLAAGAAGAQEAPTPDAPRARMRMHEPGTGLQEGVTPMRRRIGRADMVGRGGGGGPQALLQHREFLGLTDAQMAQLEEMNQAQVTQRTARAEALKARSEELASLRRQEPLDDAAIRVATEARLKLQQDAVLARLDAASGARKVLTEEQQAKWRGFEEGMRRGAGRARGMHERRGDRAHGGPERANRMRRF